MTPLELATMLTEECNRGFRDPFHWQGWLKKWRKQIDALPVRLRKQVMAAWDSATAKEFSR